MTNKSYIQLHLEFVQAKGMLEKELTQILEKYDVKDTVFGFVNRTPSELSRGYMTEVKKYDSLQEAIRDMNPGQALRVVDNKEFIVGDVFECLSDCPENQEHIFNIEFLEDVY